MIVFAIRRKSDGLYLTDFFSTPAGFGKPESARQYKTTEDAWWILRDIWSRGEGAEGTHEIVPVVAAGNFGGSGSSGSSGSAEPV